MVPYSIRNNMRTLTLSLPIPDGAEPEAITLLETAAKIFGLSTGMAVESDAARAVSSNLVLLLRNAADELRAPVTTTLVAAAALPAQS